MEKQQEIAYLFAQYVEGTISSTDLQRLLALSEGLPGEHLIRQTIERHFASEADYSARIDERAAKISELAWPHVQAHINKSRKKPSNARLWFYAIASCLVLIPIVTLFILNIGGVNKVPIAKTDIGPGTNKATLVLSGGRRFALDEKRSGIALAADAIRYTDGTQLAAATGEEEAVLQVPKGGQYSLVLSDGTTVMLNSASTLRYPIRFKEKERLVTLEGEAYFKVAKNRDRPFKVGTKGQLITVLGTHFNVQAYSHEPTETTLLEGSISLKPDHQGGKAIIMKPGQQALLTDDHLSIEQVNTEEAIAWSNNLFVFNNMPVEQIMDQLSRWYDIEIAYSVKQNKQHLYAEIPKDRTLSQVLSILEKSSGLKFHLSGRRLTVSQ